MTITPVRNYAFLGASSSMTMRTPQHRPPAQTATSYPGTYSDTGDTQPDNPGNQPAPAAAPLHTLIGANHLAGLIRQAMPRMASSPNQETSRPQPPSARKLEAAYSQASSLEGLLLQAIA